jgi:ribosome-associated translation inhibitor RaiA
MTIEIRGIERDAALRARVSRLLGATLEPLRVKPVAARATFFDDNGPKGGPAIRCALTVRVPYRPTVRVEHTAETPRLAFDGAIPTLERQLERYRERDRDRRRHPKKYFVAKRLTEGEPGGKPGKPKSRG